MTFMKLLYDAGVCINNSLKNNKIIVMNKKGFLIDMDGVIYKGSEPIPGAVEFINKLRREGHPFMFLTNNSQRTSRDVSYKLKKMGFEVTEHDIFTCAMSTARYLAKKKPHGTAYVLGEG